MSDNDDTREKGVGIEDFEAETLGGLFRLQTAGRVWAISPRLAVHLANLDGRMISAATVSAIDAARPKRKSEGKPAGGIAVLPLKGTMMGLSGGGGLLSLLFGLGGGLTDFRDGLRQAAADPEVKAIVMDVDSPGGLVDHIPEVAADVRAARAQKPVVAVSNVLAASAAYWLASQADEVVVTPSGEAGSIGVYQLHWDDSQALKKMGSKPTLISAGKYKVEGNPFEPLDDEATSAIQSDVNGYYDLFTADVAKGRGVAQSDVKDGFGEGRVLLAKPAVQAGIADRVDTVEATVRRLASPRGMAAIEQRRAEDEGLQTLIAALDDHDLLPLEGGTSGEGEGGEAVVYSPDDRHRLVHTLAGLGLHNHE